MSQSAAAKARYKERNREAIRAKGREYQKRYAAENPDKVAQSIRRYQEANPEKVQRWRTVSRERNREVIRERDRQAYSVNGWARRLWRHHRMRPDDWTALLASQDGRCYLCGDLLAGKGSGKIAIDHDHSCCPAMRSCDYCRRGITCGTCNPLVGFAQDDPDRLRRIADNLEAVLAVTRARIAAKPQQLSLIAIDEEAS